MPPAVGVAPPVASSPVVVNPAPGTAEALVPPMPASDLDARTLANRAISRELDGDRPGAIADLHAAIAKESDPTRRASMEHLLRLLQSPH